MIKVGIVVLIEKWAKEKGFYAYSPPPSKSYVNISLMASSVEYVTAWPNDNNGYVKFVWHPDVKGRCLNQKELHPGDPEFFAKAEKILSCLTPKK